MIELQYRMRIEWQRISTCIGYKYEVVIYIFNPYTNNMRGQWIACIDKAIHSEYNKEVETHYRPYFDERKFKTHAGFQALTNFFKNQGDKLGFFSGVLVKNCSAEYARYILRIAWL